MLVLNGYAEKNLLSSFRKSYPCSEQCGRHREREREREHHPLNSRVEGMDLPVFTSHSLVSTPAAGLERVAVEGGSALRNIANNYVEEGEGSSSSEEQGVTENGHHGQEEKDIDYGRLLWHASVHEGGKSICQNHNAEDALNNITKLENSAVMSGDKLSKNGQDKPENERETNLIRPTALVTERGLVCLENGVANHMDKEARQTISCEQGDGGNERSGTPIAPGNCHVETTEDAELSEEEDEHHIEDREGNAAAGGACGGTLGFDEKSLIKSQSCPCTESGDVTSPAPIYFRRRKGCGHGPLGFDGHQASCFWAAAAAPHTPQFEEPRALRCNRGIKRRFPDSWVVQVMNLTTVYQNISVSGALPVCMGMFHNLLKVLCRFSNSLSQPLLLCLFTSSRSI
jgi:hypothetical protein